jgi:hypothetical protein
MPAEVFSLKDDVVNDTNGDGDATAAAPGDWYALTVQGGTLQATGTRITCGGRISLRGSAGGSIADSVIAYNLMGFYVESGATIDLGDLNNVDPNDDGNNQIFCNQGLSLDSRQPATTMAENNFWIPSPRAGVSGNADYLPTPPSPSPDAVRGLKTSKSDDDLVLQWEGPSGLCGYRVYRSTLPDSGWIPLKGIVNDNTYTDNAVLPVIDSYYYTANPE